MDLARASDSIDALIDRRATQRDNANALSQLWQESERRHREKRRRENRALWYEFHCRLSDAHAAIAAEHEAKALALLAEPGGPVRGEGAS